MKKFRKGNNVKTHSGISDCYYEVNNYGGSRGMGINKKCSRLSMDDEILTKLNKQKSKLQEEDMNAYDFGRLSAAFGSIFKSK